MQKANVQKSVNNNMQDLEEKNKKSLKPIEIS